MITRVEATNFRCLKSVSRPLRPFQVLVGPNSSGKSAFLDVIAFIGDLVSVGLKGALAERTENFYDLVWGRKGTYFALGVEAQMPLGAPDDAKAPTIRYSVRVGLDKNVNTVKIESENVTVDDGTGNKRTVLERGLAAVAFTEESNDSRHTFRTLADVSGFWHLPDDRSRFHIAAWLRELLQENTQLVHLRNESLRAGTPAGHGKPRVYDGRDLPPCWLRNPRKTGSRIGSNISKRLSRTSRPSAPFCGQRTDSAI
ncbi:MAG: AAA family ATPase [Bryobacteraceae bacterium]